MAFGAPKPSGGLRGLWGAFGGLWCPRFRCTFWGAFEASGGLPRASPGASGVPPGASGGLGAPPGGLGGAFGAFFWVDVGFGSGFRVFWPPSTPCLADPKFQHFPGHLLETAGQWAPRATPRKPRTPPAKNAPGRSRDATGTPPGRPRTPPRTPLGRFPGRSRTPPQGPGGPPGSPKTLETPQMRPLQACEPWTLGLVAGFASFWAPSLAGPKLSAFPSHFQGGLAGSGLMPPQQNAEGQGRWV